MIRVITEAGGIEEWCRLHSRRFSGGTSRADITKQGEDSSDHLETGVRVEEEGSSDCYAIDAMKHAGLRVKETKLCEASSGTRRNP